MLEVGLAAHPVLAEQSRGALNQHPVERAIVERETADAAPAGGHGSRDLMYQSRAPCAELRRRERGRQQPHATVDVVTHSARRHDAVRQLGRGDRTDREAVPLVNIRHREHGVDHARQRCDVLQLLERAVAGDVVQQPLVGEDPRRHAHVWTCLDRDFPDHLTDAPQRRRARRVPCGRRSGRSSRFVLDRPQS
jgi:hypothetical protein